MTGACLKALKTHAWHAVTKLVNVNGCSKWTTMTIILSVNDTFVQEKKVLFWNCTPQVAFWDFISSVGQLASLSREMDRALNGTSIIWDREVVERDGAGAMSGWSTTWLIMTIREKNFKMQIGIDKGDNCLCKIRNFDFSFCPRQHFFKTLFISFFYFYFSHFRNSIID